MTAPDHRPVGLADKRLDVKPGVEGVNTGWSRA